MDVRTEILADTDPALQPALAKAARDLSAEYSRTKVIDGQLGGDLEKFCVGELDLVGVVGSRPSAEGGCEEQKRSFAVPVRITVRGASSSGRYLFRHSAMERPEVRALASSLISILAIEPGSLELLPGFEGLEPEQ